MKELIDGIARVGVMGIIAIAVVGAVVFLAGYSVVRGIENENTTTLVTVLVAGAGAVLTSVGRFFNGNDEQ